MGIIDLINNLHLHFSPSFSKKTGTNSTQSKIKAKNVKGDVAGRDIKKTYIKNQKQKKEPPCVYVDGAFGGNGHVMKFMACTTHNLSDQFIIIGKIKVIDAVIPFNDTLVKAGESLQHSGVDGLSYPATDDSKQAVKIYFQTRNSKEFVSTQKLKFQTRNGDGKFNIIGLEKPTIKEVKHEK